MLRASDDRALAEVVSGTTAHGAFDRHLGHHLIEREHGDFRPRDSADVRNASVQGLAILDLGVDVIGDKDDPPGARAERRSAWPARQRCV